MAEIVEGGLEIVHGDEQQRAPVFVRVAHAGEVADHALAVGRTANPS